MDDLITYLVCGVSARGGSGVSTRGGSDVSARGGSRLNICLNFGTGFALTSVYNFHFFWFL